MCKYLTEISAFKAVFENMAKNIASLMMNFLTAWSESNKIRTTDFSKEISYCTSS
jgi:hypothetical protein